MDELYEGLSEDAIKILTEGAQQEEGGLQQEQPLPEEQPSQDLLIPEQPKEKQPPQAPDSMEQRFAQYEQNMQRLYQNEMYAAQTIRRQQAELESLRQRFQEPQQKQPEQDPLPEDPMERMVEQKVRAQMAKMEDTLHQKQQQEIAPISQTLRQQQVMSAWQQRAQHSQESARQRYEDYDDIAMGAVPWLQNMQQRAGMGDQTAQGFVNMIMASPDPAEVLYTIGHRIRWEQQKAQVKNQPAQAPAQQPKTTPQGTPPQGGNVVQLPRGADIPGGGARAGAPELDLNNLTSAEWRKLPEDVRLKILRGE